MASQVIDQPAVDEIRPDDRMKFALSVIGGTLAGAGAFGKLVGCLAGLIIGPVLAVIAGLPVFLATILAAWSRSLPRYYAIPAILCGALTGFLSSSGGVLPDLRAYEFFVILATTIGGAGSAIAGIVFIHATVAGSAKPERSPALHDRSARSFFISRLSVCWGPVSSGQPIRFA